MTIGTVHVRRLRGIYLLLRPGSWKRKNYGSGQRRVAKRRKPIASDRNSSAWQMRWIVDPRKSCALSRNNYDRNSRFFAEQRKPLEHLPSRPVKLHTRLV
jgi:hypothetical protein